RTANTTLHEAAAFSSCISTPWEPRNEDARASLVVAILVAARSQRLRLGGWNPCHAEKEIEHRRPTGDRNPAVRRGRRGGRGGDHHQPLEELVRMPRITPEAALARVAPALGIFLEAKQLPIRGGLAREADDPQRGRGELDRRQHRRRIHSREERRQREERGGECLFLKEPEELPIRALAPSLAHRLIARVLGAPEHAVPENVDAEPRAPRAHHPADCRSPRPGAAADVRIEDREARNQERPARVHYAGISNADVPDPEGGHRDCG